jgi:hypothetical protein
MQAEEQYGNGGFICECIDYVWKRRSDFFQMLGVGHTSLCVKMLKDLRTMGLLLDDIYLFCNYKMDTRSCDFGLFLLMQPLPMTTERLYNGVQLISPPPEETLRRASLLSTLFRSSCPHNSSLAINTGTIQA